MPLYPCRQNFCPTLVQRRGEYCAQHVELGQQERAERNRFYDQHQRDPAAAKFYHSIEWRTARYKKLSAFPVCQRCNQEWATTVHHRIPLAECKPEQRCDQDLLMACCDPCHNIIEAELEAVKCSS